MEFLKTVSRLPIAFFPNSLRGQSIITCTPVFTGSRWRTLRHISGANEPAKSAVCDPAVLVAYYRTLHHVHSFTLIQASFLKWFNIIRQCFAGTPGLEPELWLLSTDVRQLLESSICSQLRGSKCWKRIMISLRTPREMSKESQQPALFLGCGKVQSTSCPSLKGTDIGTHIHTLHTYIDGSSGMHLSIHWQDVICRILCPLYPIQCSQNFIILVYQCEIQLLRCTSDQESMDRSDAINLRDAYHRTRKGRSFTFVSVYCM